MLARINPSPTSASGAASLPAADNAPTRKTKAAKTGTAANDADNDFQTAGASSTRASTATAGIQSKILPQIQDSFQAAQSLDFLKSKMFTSPATALAAQGNVTADTVLSLAQD